MAVGGGQGHVAQARRAKAVQVLSVAGFARATKIAMAVESVAFTRPDLRHRDCVELEVGLQSAAVTAGAGRVAATLVEKMHAAFGVATHRPELAAQIAVKRASVGAPGRTFKCGNGVGGMNESDLLRLAHVVKRGAEKIDIFRYGLQSLSQ